MFASVGNCVHHAEFPCYCIDKAGGQKASNSLFVGHGGSVAAVALSMRMWVRS